MLKIGGSGLGQVHVHVKGVGKILITAADDLKNIPGEIRSNEAVKAAILKAFEWLSNVKD